jgi:cation diffusion facilitator CzcD-associated flavoprotein CzcO
MSCVQESSAATAQGVALDFDAVVIGGGVSGIYSLYRLRELGLRVCLLATGDGVGGTWYWNKYPGARLDSESWTYGFSFAPVLEEWGWTENFVGQPELERYFNYVVDKFDLRSNIQLQSKVTQAHFQDESSSWEVTLEDGRSYTTRYVVPALGLLSAATLPKIPGVESFQGQSCHTHDWPQEPVSFEGKRVAVIGTASTGVQIITEVSKEAEQVTVFQRTPQWCVPLNNSTVSAEQMDEIRAKYPQIFELCQQTYGCYIHEPDKRGTFEVSDEERAAFWEQRYREPGMGIWLGNFRDILTDRQANKLISNFLADKIRGRVNDPVLAERLIPKNHGFGTRRVVLESGYYESYNRPNVTLVDVNETPIERVTPTGITTSAADYEFDIIVYATGYDAFTGSYDRIDFRGTNGASLKEKWQDGPQTFLGILVDEFPNMLMLMGPHAGIGNFPRAMEYTTDWIIDLLRYARDRKSTRIETTAVGVKEWTDHVIESAEGLLYLEIDSWMTGVNRNIDGHAVRRVLRYNGGHPAFRARAEAVAAAGYREVAITKSHGWALLKLWAPRRVGGPARCDVRGAR